MLQLCRLTKSERIIRFLVLYRGSYEVNMGTVDSEALFDSRMTVFKLSAQEQADVRAHGWTTHAGFAFSSSYTPNQIDDAPFVNAVLIPVLGAENHPSAHKLRRLLFESFTMAVQDLRVSMDRTSDSTPRRIPQPERAARFAKLQAKLVGLKLEDLLEPSHRLTDLAMQIHEDDAVRYVQWSECTSRNQEVQGEKKDKEVETKTWRPDSSGIVRESQAQSFQQADVASDYKFRQALARRGLAFVIANIMDYDVHEQLADHLTSAFVREPLQGYSKVSILQIEQADRHCFGRMANLTRMGIRQKPDGTYPLHDALSKTMASTEFNMLLMPDRAATSLKREREDQVTKAKPKAKSEAKTKTGGVPPPPKAPSRRQESKGRGKGKGVPDELKDLARNRPDGAPLCFGYNLGTCAKCEPGARCSRGWHQCMKPGCTANHPQNAHV